MAIVQAGKTFTAADVKRTGGDIASHLANRMQDGTDFAGQLASWSDEDLIALGLTQADCNALKGFFIGDLPAMKNLLTASAWLRQLLGLGV